MTPYFLCRTKSLCAKLAADGETMLQATKVMWCPDKEPVSSTRDLLATTGDYLRLWNITPQGAKMEGLLNNVSCPGGRKGDRFLIKLESDPHVSSDLRQ
jgi:hypothetical protein